jgi:hypothetical protein
MNDIPHVVDHIKALIGPPMEAKTRLVPITTAPELAAVQAGAAGDLGKPFGVRIGEAWYAEADEIDQYRQAQYRQSFRS